jgi:hypothetical protein
LKAFTSFLVLSLETLTQSRYIYLIFERDKMTEAKPVSTLMATSPALIKFRGESMSDPFQFRSVVGVVKP